MDKQIIFKKVYLGRYLVQLAEWDANSHRIYDCTMLDMNRDLEYASVMYYRPDDALADTLTHLAVSLWESGWYQ